LVFIDVTVTIKSRIVTVKGPRGTITKPFNHKAIEIKIMNEATKNRQGKHIRLRMWNASYREAAAVTTFKSLIANMLTGVTEGFRYKMRLVYNHFPINIVIAKDKKTLEIVNFLGGKKSHHIKLPPGATVIKSSDVKDELVFDGPDNSTLSLACARVNQSCGIGNKDERKFLDGIFVSEKTLIQPRD